MRAFLVLALASVFFIACNKDGATSQQADTTVPAGQNQYSTTYLDNKKRRSEAEKPEIKIQVSGLNGGIATLVGVFTDQNYKADSVAIDPTGQMVFKRDSAYFPGLYYLVLPQNRTLQLLLDLDQTFTMKTSMNNPFMDMQVEGSVDNQLLYDAMRFEESQRTLFQAVSQKMAGLKPGDPNYLSVKAEQDKLLGERINYLNKLFADNPNTLFTSFKRAGQNPDLRDCYKPDGALDTARYTYMYRTRFWNGVDFNDERLLYTPVVSKMLTRYITELTPQVPDSIVKYSIMLVDKAEGKPEFFKYLANWIVLNYDPKKSTLMDPQAVFVNMIERYFTYDKAFWSDSVEVYGLQQRAYEMSASLTGKKAPDVQAKDVTGAMRSIYEMKAPYIVVYMWNPDCEHCAEQTPTLVKMYKNWKAQGNIDVFGIAVNTEDAKYKSTVQKYGMQWVNVFDPTNKSIYGKYYVDNTPEVYVLNPDRTIIGKNLNVDQIMEVVNRDMEKRKK